MDNRRRIVDIVQTTNALNADVVVLLGDYVAGHSKITRIVPDQMWARALARLRAPLGVYAILGNHDWWADPIAQARGHGPIAARKALEDAGVAVLENDYMQRSKDGQTFWIAGLGDQLALNREARSRGRRGVDDVGATLTEIPAQQPIILLVHEPDIFSNLPDRVTVILVGHTHGGQIRFFGYAPVMPSPISRLYSYGHFVEGGQTSDRLGWPWVLLVVDSFWHSAGNRLRRDRREDEWRICRADRELKVHFGAFSQETPQSTPASHESSNLSAQFFESLYASDLGG